MRLENWIGQVTKGVVGPAEGCGFCSKYDEKQRNGIYLRGVTLAAAKYFNSNKLSIIVLPYLWGMRSGNPSGCLKLQVVPIPTYAVFPYTYIPMAKLNL